MGLFAIGVFIFLLSGHYPQMTEKVYSSFVYKLIGRTLSNITGIAPFSLAEIIIVLLTLFTLRYLIKAAAIIIKGEGGKIRFKKIFVSIFTAAAIIYFAFQILWGINYNRIELAEMLNYDVREPSKHELVLLCEDLIYSANELRGNLMEDGQGVTKIPYGKRGVLQSAYKGYDKASEYYPHLEGKYGNPKGIFLSKAMSYTGITGFYFPFTAEANINMDIPEPLFAFTVTHEMAHQRGFAREEEANFLAYVTCINHPDEYFKYAGTLSAMIYSMNALAGSDIEKYNELTDTYSEGVERDLRFQNDYWNRHSGPVEEASDKINDTYLKSQNQKTGVASYGAIVDLLIAQRRNIHNKDGVGDL